jgi:NADPH-dependent 2,4-dienoyl-CoA reductase/sulfur reductase-like enzyme
MLHARPACPLGLDGQPSEVDLYQAKIVKGKHLVDDVVIVGGGPSGLATAYEANSHGAKVYVLECRSVVGDLLRTTLF